jgi:hypothetical protein
VLISDGFYLLFLYPLLAVVYSLIFHLVWKNFLQVVKGPYAATLTACLLGTLVTIIFVWLVPSPLYSTYATWGFLLSFIVLLWMFGVTAIAISEQHGIPRQTAFGLMIVLGVLAVVLPIVSLLFFSLGVFGAGALLGTSCIAGPGFQCYGAHVSSPNVLSVTIGQSTGQSFTSVNVTFVPYTSSDSNPASLFSNQNLVANIHSGLLSGQSASVLLPITNATPTGPPGFVCNPSISGSIWMQYQTSQNGQFLYAKIATLYLR